MADIKVFVTELASYYSELSEEVSSSGRTNSITSSLPSTTMRHFYPSWIIVFRIIIRVFCINLRGNCIPKIKEHSMSLSRDSDGRLNLSL